MAPQWLHSLLLLMQTMVADRPTSLYLPVRQLLALQQGLALLQRLLLLPLMGG
jgi:hypothetical protein